MTNLNQLSKEIHENAVAHGWWETPPTFPEIIALCHSELSEALEDYRNGWACLSIENDTNKPYGVPVELADCIIRILDYCGRNKIDIETAIQIKHEYNKTRPYRHGGKRC